MTVQDTQDDTAAKPVVPTVPVGTPGRDSRAELPTPLPPGAQQPWRKLGPGNRAWIVVITVLATVVMSVVALFALVFGVANNAFDRSGVVVLGPAQFDLKGSGCTGTGDDADVRKGARVEFRAQSTDRGGYFTATLGEGALRNGRCLFPFTVSTLDPSPNYGYEVTVGGRKASPVSGQELTTTGDPVLIYVA